MKILIDARTTQDEIKYNGVGRYSRFIIEYLIQNNPETNFELIMYDGFSTLDEFLKTKHSNVNIFRIGEFNDKGGINLILHNLDLFFHIRLNKVLRKINRKDTVFFSPYFWKGLPVFKIPTVVTFHDFALPYFNIYSTISPIHNFLRFVHYWSELLRIYFAKHVICDSNYTYLDMFKYLPKLKKENVSEVLLGIHEEKKDVEYEKYLPSDWKKKGYIIYLGSGLTKNKNSEGVVKGYKEFLDILKNEKIKEEDFPYLVIAGKNFTDEVVKDAKKFRHLVMELGIEKYVHYSGFYDDDARWPMVRNAFAYIHLSIFEGFGFSVAEAMRAKVPVIAHNGTTYPQVVGDGGILVDGLKPHEVGQAIFKVFNDKEFAKKLALKGYEQSLKFDWNITAEKTFNIIKKISNGINK